jgi:hypothetical protein
MKAQAVRGLTVAVILVLASGAGCRSGRAPKVECDQRLQPINTPAPKVKEGTIQRPPADPPASGPAHE